MEDHQLVDIGYIRHKGSVLSQKIALSLAIGERYSVHSRP